MRKKGKITAGISAVLLAALLGSVTVMADTAAPEPVVSIETDREEYSVGDPISETVKIYNASEETMTDIRIQGSIPEGYQTEEGVSGQWEAQIEKAEAGKILETGVKLIRKTTGEVPDGNNGEDPSDTGSTSKDPGVKPGQKPAAGAAKTGDGVEVILWAAAAAAGICAVGAAVRSKKGKRFLSLLLVAALTGTLLPAAGTSVQAAEAEPTTEKTAEAAKQITVDGKEVTLTARITYQVKNQEEDTSLSYEGYELKWEDQFEGETLNRDDWNVELHDPGWVNNELQSYVDSPENIYIEDGSLVLKPVEKVNEDGTVSYTSGRVNTQNKHDFKYGLFEARVKVPEGQGFLPAFWMMPTNENLYGQWPRCGEIDIMEVLGNDTDTSYGTIHYGNPHSESQGSYTLEEGTFSEEYHVFDVEWEPGKISWYVDGKLIHTESSWYSATEGQGEITYPAPFDQPFYIILNLAVGGNWPGNPDETTVSQAQHTILIT